MKHRLIRWSIHTREAEDLIERERNNRGVVLFFSSSELIDRRGKLESDRKQRRRSWAVTLLSTSALTSSPIDLLPLTIKERNNYIWSRAVLQCCLQVLSYESSVYLISLWFEGGLWFIESWFALLNIAFIDLVTLHIFIKTNLVKLV